MRVGTIGTTSGPLLAALLIVPTLGLAAAPVNSAAAQRAALPADLRQRRRTEALRERRVVAGSAMAASGAVAGVAAFGVVLGLLMAPGRVATPPNPLHPGPGSGGAAPAGPQRTTAPGGRAKAPGSPSPSASTTPTPSGTTPTPSGTPTGTPTPSTSPTPSASPTPSGLPTPSASVPATPSAGGPATPSLGPAASPG